MTGVKYPGGEVWRAIQRLELGLGFEAGPGIVIILDCSLQNSGKKKL